MKTTRFRFLTFGMAVLLVSSVGAADVVTQPVRIFGLGEVQVVSVSPDGERVATAGPSGAFLWDRATRRMIRRWEALGSAVTALAWAPDGSALLTGARDGVMREWEAASGALLRTYEGHRRDIQSLDCSPDGTAWVSGSPDNDARVWSRNTGEVLQTFTVRGWFIQGVAFSPDGTRVATADGSPTNNVGVWNVASGEREQTLSGHAGGARAVAFLPDGRLVSGGEDRRVRVWSRDPGEAPRVLEGATDTVSSLVVPQDGSRVVAGAFDGAVLVWNPDLGTRVKELRRERFGSLSADAAGRWGAVATIDQRVEILDLVEGTPDGDLLGHTTATFTGVGFSPDLRDILAGGLEAAIRRWNRTHREPLASFVGSRGGTMAATYFPDGTRVLTTAGEPRPVLRIWRADTGAVERELVGHTGFPVAAAVSADGRRVVSSALDATVRLWDPDTGALLRTLAGSPGADGVVAMSPDSRILAAGGNVAHPSVRLWDAGTGQVLRTFTEDAGGVTALEFSRSGRTLLVGWEGGLIRLLDVESGKLLREIVVPSAFLETAVLSPDERFVLTAESFPGLIARLWDVRTGEPVRVFLGHTSPVTAVAFSARGLEVLTAGDNVRLWSVADLMSGLRVDRGEGGVEVRWDLGRLVGASTPAGPWAPIPGAVSPWRPDPSAGPQFYRVDVSGVADGN